MLHVVGRDDFAKISDQMGKEKKKGKSKAKDKNKSQEGLSLLEAAIKFDRKDAVELLKRLGVEE